MKKISLLILTFMCSLLMTVPVWADDTGFIRDTIGYLEAYEEEMLEAEAASIAEAYDYQTYFAIVDSDLENLDSHAQSLYQSVAGDANGVLLMVDAFRNQWSIYYGGSQGKSLMRFDKEDFLWTSFFKELDWYEGIKSYLTTVKTKFEKPALVVGGTDGRRGVGGGISQRRPGLHRPPAEVVRWPVAPRSTPCPANSKPSSNACCSTARTAVIWRCLPG